MIPVGRMIIDHYDFCPDPYVRILMFNGSGRLDKKKKTTVKVGLTKLSGVALSLMIDLEFAKFCSSKVNTREPVFNETLNFEVEISDDCNNCSMIIIERKL